MCVRMREYLRKIDCLEIPRTTDALIISQFGIILNSNCFGMPMQYNANFR